MKEIRPILEHEADEFLRIVCSVFNLDFNKARNVYYTEPFFDLKRKWALIENNKLISILTTTPLQFGFGNAIGIAGVATIPQAQNQSYATSLIKEVLSYSKQQKEGSCLLFAPNQSLYEKLGFKKLDTVVKGKIQLDSPKQKSSDEMSFSDVLRIYQDWSEAHPMRLRRDPKRWNYWLFTPKKCLHSEGGYVCLDSNSIREAITPTTFSAWNSVVGQNWIGLSNLTKSLQIPIKNLSEETTLMGYNFPETPQMFLSDQF